MSQRKPSSQIAVDAQRKGSRAVQRIDSSTVVVQYQAPVAADLGGELTPPGFLMDIDEEDELPQKKERKWSGNVKPRPPVIFPDDDGDGKDDPVKTGSKITGNGFSYEENRALALEMVKQATKRAKETRKKAELTRCLKGAEMLHATGAKAYLDGMHVLSLIDAEERAAQEEAKLIANAAASMVKGRTMHPQSRFMQRWDLFMLLLMCFTAIVTPYEIGFLSTEINGLFFVNRISDIGFFIDMFIQFRLGFFDVNRQTFEMRQGIIIKRYLMGWFIIDSVSTMPYDCLGIIMSGGGSEEDAVAQMAGAGAVEAGAAAAGEASNLEQLKILRILKLLKMVKMIRVLKSARMVKRLIASLGISNSNTALLKFMFLIMAMLHWTACVWRMVPDLEGGETSWITTDSCPAATLPLSAGDGDGDGGSSTGNSSIYDDGYGSVQMSVVVDPGTVYLHTFEFAIKIMAFSYTGCGPSTGFERGVALVIMLVAGSCYGYVIGGICGILATLDPVTQEFRDTMDLTKMYMREVNAPRELGQDVSNYFEHCQKLYGDQLFKSEIVSDLTPSLQQRCATHQFNRCVANVYFFCCNDPEEKDRFVSDLALVMKLGAFPPGEDIFKEGAIATAMGIVLRGVVRRKLKVLKEDAFFAEESIIHDATYQASATAVTFVDLAILTRKRLFGMIAAGVEKQLYPQTTKLIRKAGIRMSFLKVIHEIGRSVIVLKRAEWEKKRRDEGKPYHGEHRFRRMTAKHIEVYKAQMKARVEKYEADRALLSKPSVFDFETDETLAAKEGKEGNTTVAFDATQTRKLSNLLDMWQGKKEGMLPQMTKTMAEVVIALWNGKPVEGPPKIVDRLEELVFAGAAGGPLAESCCRELEDWRSRKEGMAAEVKEARAKAEAEANMAMGVTERAQVKRSAAAKLEHEMKMAEEAADPSLPLEDFEVKHKLYEIAAEEFAILDKEAKKVEKDALSAQSIADEAQAIASRLRKKQKEINDPKEKQEEAAELSEAELNTLKEQKSHELQCNIRIREHITQRFIKLQEKLARELGEKVQLLTDEMEELQSVVGVEMLKNRAIAEECAAKQRLRMKRLARSKSPKKGRKTKRKAKPK
jgi:potassium voltage-gated channel Eag-related subfamily H protein 7